MSTNNVHKLAQAGFGQGTNQLYDRLGAGTGIFTRAFLSHPDWASVVKELRAVEPSEGMRDQFSQKISDPARVSVAPGTFDDTHIPDGWADLIVVVMTAQAFHWCPDYEKAAIEFNRVLSPDGRVVLIWNLEDDATPWIAQLRKLIEAYEQGSPQFRLGLWRQTFDTPSYKELFQPPQELLFRHIVTGTVKGVIDRAFSKSYIAITPEHTKDMLTKEITAIMSKGDGKVWIDESDGTFEYPYNTTVIIIQKH
ncbi:hypothetical protein Clacol_006341 [Clathrus columnatus]|uniref:Methyltransferase type 11 domain-containing protein n=1 Tax=Clathrus columnatus TaxID=1419009 RepID=A0AAV5AJH5_9AGAM|nr:hypothetical protein Clacol_006341 [Clathrus columnatus]